MGTSPYRLPEETNRASETNVVAGLAELGPQRSVHAPAPLRIRLLHAAVVAFLLVVLGAGWAFEFGPPAVAVGLALATLCSVPLAWTPLRMRHVRVALHAYGVTVTTKKGRSVILFDAVDEVWMDLHRSSTPLGSAAVVRGLDLVDRVGNRHRIPTVLVGAPEIVRWVTRHCSDPLRVDASRALSDGETLTFGTIQIDREGIRGASWASRWQDLSLVRHVPGGVCLFRWQHVIPWKTIELDRVPHPTLFAKLVSECAKKVETYDPLGLLDR